MNKKSTQKYTSDNIELKQFYLNNDLPSEAITQEPGKFPFTRGIHNDMYRGRPWTMRQYSGFGSVEETNERFKYLIKTGASGLSVAFDLPTQMGLDSDNPMADGEVGKTGVAIDTILDVDRLFDQIPLDLISSSMTINSTAHILLAFYLVVAERRGIPWGSLRGTVQNDLLKEFIARGTYVFGPEASLRVATDIIEFCSKNVPLWNPISISGYHMREAGSTAAQEIAFTLLNGLTYVEAVLQRGLSIDDFAPRLAFFMNCHNDFFEEIAKFRAARSLWATLVKERYSPKNSKSMLFRFHTQTAGSSLVAQQPMNNIMRTSYQALAAVLGGTQSLHTNSYDEALNLPTEASALLALRTQQVLMEETGVINVADPLGGSYFIEDLTKKLEIKALEIIQKIELNGGVVKSISDGLIQGMIEDSAYRYQVDIENKNKKIVGQNSYLENSECTRSQNIKFKIDPQIELVQIQKLKDFRANRDNKLHKASLDGLRKVAIGKENLMPAVLDCARSMATLGEISDVLVGIFGQYRQ